MSIKTIKKLVENRLKTLSPSLPIAWTNVSFTAPADGSKYLRCTLNIRTPDDSCIGGTYYRENATFNVYVLDKLNIGSGGALDTAEAIRDLFDKRTTLEEGNVRVQILQTPHIAGEVITNDRLVIPIAIRLTAEIF